jgi:hypothetical protein
MDTGLLHREIKHLSLQGTCVLLFLKTRLRPRLSRSNLRRLRREYDAAMEERVVEEHFGGKEGVVLRGTVTAVGGDRKKDAILQIMPGK